MRWRRRWARHPAWSARSTYGPNAPTGAADVQGRYAESTLKKRRAGNRARREDAFSRGKWWEIFGDQQLNALVEQIEVNNQTLALAEAQYRGARAAIRVTRSQLYPTVTGGASPSRAAELPRQPVAASGAAQSAI